MTVRRYLQLDVFADRPGAGNALAVVLDAEGLDDATEWAVERAESHNDLAGGVLITGSITLVAEARILLGKEGN